MPVKYRYRSPIVFEFHTAGKRAADAYAVVWLQHLTDNEEENVNIPIWKTSNGERLTQNYVTEENLRTLKGYEDVQEVGRLHFRGRFKTGTDEDHAQFVSDNDSRETQETWEACRAEGVRGKYVTKELPAKVQKLHEQSLTDGRDVLKQAEPDEKRKWLSKDGTDWSGAFGEDPAKYVEGGYKEKPLPPPPSAVKPHDQANPSSDDDDDDDDDDNNDSDSSSDLGVQDASNPEPKAAAAVANGDATEGKPHGSGPVGQYKNYKDGEKENHRRHRGLMQWKPMRNAAFAKDEAKFAVKKVRNKMSLKGREPDVETEA